jgi:hypothetical protein
MRRDYGALENPNFPDPSLLKTPLIAVLIRRLNLGIRDGGRWNEVPRQSLGTRN